MLIVLHICSIEMIFTQLNSSFNLNTLPIRQHLQQINAVATAAKLLRVPQCTVSVVVLSAGHFHPVLGYVHFLHLFPALACQGVNWVQEHERLNVHRHNL